MCIPVSILNDNVVEANKLFTVTLESTDPAVQFTLSFASVTIIDSSGKYLLCVCLPSSFIQAHIIVTCLNNSFNELWYPYAFFLFVCFGGGGGGGGSHCFGLNTGGLFFFFFKTKD